MIGIIVWGRVYNIVHKRKTVKWIVKIFNIWIETQHILMQKKSKLGTFYHHMIHHLNMFEIAFWFL